MAAKKKKDKNETSRLEEPAAPYIKGPHLNLPVAKAAMVFGKPLLEMSSFEKIDVIRTGVSKNYLESIKETAHLDYDQLAQALSVTRATLINKKGKEKFGSAVSERIVSIAEIYAYGYEVFGDKEKFNRWILKPNKALGGLVPYDLLDNQYGREEVKTIIGRIDYGVYS